jgi:hypothetical protein
MKDMYKNIPQQDATHVIHNILKNDENMADNIQNMLQTILEQNYFQFDNQYYKQNIGLAMGAPTLAITAETHLQSLEHNQVYNLLTKHKIFLYFRYADDTLTIYDKKNKKHTDTMMIEFTTMHPAINFTIENEADKKLNFLDLTIHREHNKLNFTKNKTHINRHSYP